METRSYEGWAIIEMMGHTKIAGESLDRGGWSDTSYSPGYLHRRRRKASNAVFAER